MDQDIKKYLTTIINNQEDIIKNLKESKAKISSFDVKVTAIEHKTDRIFNSVRPVIDKVMGE